MATKTDARAAARRVFVEVANVIRKLERGNRWLWIILVFVLLVSIPTIAAATYWMWRAKPSETPGAPPAVSVPTSPQVPEPPKDEGKKPEGPAPVVPPSFGPGGSTVTDVPFSRGDPNFAGIERRLHWTVPVHQHGWIPGRDLSKIDQKTPDVLWLQGGKAHTIKSLQKPSGVVELAFFYPAASERTQSCTVDPNDLVSETGFGLYPAKDAVLILRWKRPTDTAEPFTFEIDRSSKSAKEAMKGKTLCHVGIAP